MQTMKSMVFVSLIVVGGLFSVELRGAAAEVVFPGKTWATKTPAEVGLDVDKLTAFSQFVGGPRSMWAMPRLDIVVSYNDAKLRDRSYGEKSGTNQAMKRLVAAVRQP